MTEPDRDLYAPSAHTDPPPPAPVMPTDSVTRGARIAGMLLIANAFLVVLEHLLIATPAGKSSPGSGMLPAIIDVIIGASLLRGLNKYRTWAIARVVLGALFFVAIQATQGDWLTAVMQLMVSGALLGLLLGDARQPRIIISCAVFGLYVLVSVAGLAAVLTGTNVLAPAVMQLSGDIEATPAGEVHGRQFDYRITAPGKQWFLRKVEAAKRGNPLVDRWLVRPDADAHVMIIAGKLANGGTVDADALLKLVLRKRNDENKQFRVLEQGKLPGQPNGRFARATAETGGMKITYYYAVFAEGSMACQVVCFAGSAGYDAVSKDLLAIVGSFRPAPAP